MQILYVTDSRHGHRAWLDPSARHRVYHYADALAATACGIQVAHIEDITASLTQRFDHIIFHRPKFTARFETAFKICHQSQAILHADYDDLIFDSEYSEFSPLYLNGNRPLRKVAEYFERNHEAALKFKYFLVSTRYLATCIKKSVPEAIVTTLPNSLPRQFKRPEGKRPSMEKFTIGYFPGSNSHGHDLNMIGDVLTQFLGKSEKCRLVIAGRFDKDEINNKNLQAEHLPYMDYRRYLSLLSMVNISIAPLEDNPFNAAKSAVKLIESVAVGTPILVSNNPDMADHQNSLSTIVNETADWESELEKSMQRAFTSAPPLNETLDYNETLDCKYRVCSRLPLLLEHLQCAA